MALPQLEKQNVHSNVVQTFIDAVLSDQMHPGQKLPSEVQLASSLQISRNILREAMKTLEVLGVIESLHGKGTFISENAKQRIANIDFIEALARNQTIKELFEARIVIEPGLVQYAAERRTARDIELLWAASDKLFDADAPDAEMTFHQVVANVSRCTIPSKYLDSIFKQLRYSDYGVFVAGLSKSQIQEELLEHRRIVEYIINQDAKGARNLMYHHIVSRMDFIILHCKRPGE